MNHFVRLMVGFFVRTAQDNSQNCEWIGIKFSGSVHTGPIKK